MGGISRPRRLSSLAALALAALVAASARAGAGGGAGAVTFTVAGDYGMGPDAAATLSLVGRTHPDFHLAIGDLSYAGRGSERGWCRFVRARVGPDLPFELVSGNHEDDYGGDGRIDNFARCLPDRLGAKGAYAKEYYFDYRRLLRVILISPDLTIDGRNYFYGANNAHFRWLRATIRGARRAGIPWVVVAMHKNCLSVGVYYCNVYQELLDLLVSERVDLVLHGHDHTYQRTHQLALSRRCPRVLVDHFDRDCIADDGRDGRYRRGAGAVFVVVGTGGAPLYPVKSTDPEAGYFATWMGANERPRKGFLRVRVTRTRLEAEFVGSTRTSSFGDRFSIVR